MLLDFFKRQATGLGRVAEHQCGSDDGPYGDDRNGAGDAAQWEDEDADTDLEGAWPLLEIAEMELARLTQALASLGEADTAVEGTPSTYEACR